MKASIFSFIASIVLFAAMLSPASSTAASESQKTLRANLAIIPGLIEPQGTGPFVDLFHLIAKHIDGKVTMEVLPGHRSIDNVINDRADFHLPAIKLPLEKKPNSAYRFSTEPYGKVAFVIYSNAKKPMTKEMILSAVSHQGPYPYVIEMPPFAENVLDCPTLPTSDLENSLKKVLMGRIDALIWAQEESDATIKKLKLTYIHRELFNMFDDAFIVSNTSHGADVDMVLSSAVKKAKLDKQYAKAYEKVHRPFVPWQPIDMKDVWK